VIGGRFYPRRDFAAAVAVGLSALGTSRLKPAAAPFTNARRSIALVTLVSNLAVGA
jgi:hypothetical protein